MNNKKKRIFFLIGIIVLVIVVIATITNLVKKKEQTKTTFEEGKASSSVFVEEIEFKDITQTYENGITTIKANVYNNTKQAKDVNVKIILIDETKKEVKTMVQAIENIEPGKKKLLATGIVGDYSVIQEVRFELIKDSEVEKYN